jgi:xanthine dehydrogenase accessory factor
VLGFLADRGVPAEMLESVRVPVGLDLGHTSHNEIAVSVLAELVALRATGELGGTMAPASMPTTAPAQAVDLVCGMTIPADDTSRPLEHEGTTYFFCCPGCRVAFAKDPEKYIKEGVA